MGLIMGILRTKDVIALEEETDKNIEDFCDEEYFIKTYGYDYGEEYDSDEEEYGSDEEDCEE